MLSSRAFDVCHGMHNSEAAPSQRVDFDKSRNVEQGGLFVVCWESILFDMERKL